MATIRERVEAMLLAEDAVCATTFWQEYMPSARNRVSELRAEGWNIVSEPCDRLDHRGRHRNPTIQYRLVSEPVQLELGGTTL